MAFRKLVTFSCVQHRSAFSSHSLVGSSLKRQLFSGPRASPKNGGGMWRRLLAYEARETVKAIPVEHAPARTGFNAGKAVLAGGAAFGIGSLCVYGLGLTSETGAIDRMGLWSSEIKARVHKTYGFFTYGLATTAAAAYAATKNSSIMRFMVARPIMSTVVFFVGSIGSMFVTYGIPYSPETLPLKIGAFTLFSAIMGATMAPLIGIAGPLVARAAAYTAGVVGGLTLTAACAPSEKYLYMGGPLAVGLGVVLVASIGSMFAAPGGAVFSGLYSVYMYGGLVLFGGFMLYDTQKIIHHAENDAQYDPINRSIGIYLNTINIFIRILMLLSGSGNKRK